MQYNTNKYFKKLLIKIELNIREWYVYYRSLVQRKNQTTYTQLFQKKMERCAKINVRVFPDPTTIYIDFDEAAINSIVKFLGMWERYMEFFFHVTQSTHRKVQQLQLVKRYKNNKNINRFCRTIDGLAFCARCQQENGVMKGVESGQNI